VQVRILQPVSSKINPSRFAVASRPHLTKGQLINGLLQSLRSHERRSWTTDHSHAHEPDDADDDVPPPFEFKRADRDEGHEEDCEGNH
jgi:hypothetical protein